MKMKNEVSPADPRVMTFEASSEEMAAAEPVLLLHLLQNIELMRANKLMLALTEVEWQVMRIALVDRLRGLIADAQAGH